jgi:glycosyltransferase involved in cell wall biosynthesis
MKLSIISTTGGGYAWAGSEEMWRILAESLLSKGHSLRLNIASSMSNADELTKLKASGCQVISRPDLNPITRRLAEKGMYSRFSRQHGTNDDIVILSMGAVADCVWIPDLLNYYNKCSAPCVVIVQGNGENIISQESQREILRRFYARALAVIFVSQKNLDLAERQLAWHFPNALVVPNPIRERLESPLSWPIANDGVFRLAEVGRLDVIQKRQDHLLEALATEAWRSRPWKLTFYGSGPDERHIRSLVSHFQLESKVEFGGFLKDFTEIWRENHLHILPTAYEGLSLSLIESMFCGRPAIVTRAGGNPDLVRDGLDGFVCPGMHPEIIRHTLDQAWASRDTWKWMGLSAFARVQHFIPINWESQVLELIELKGNK